MDQRSRRSGPANAGPSGSRPAQEPAGDSQRRIEAAALSLFTTRGFHGTNNREIAERAGVSTAAIYTYYPSKEAIFAELAKKYRWRIHQWLHDTVSTLKDPLSKRDLRAFASAILSKMRNEPEYLLLVLIDVIEFNNRHFRGSFDNIPERLRARVGEALDRAARRPEWRGHDPAFVLAAVYHYFFHFALIEEHMRGNQHLGVPHDAAIERFVDLICSGLWSRAPEFDRGLPREGENAPAQQQMLDDAARDRIEFIRLLSGRLWSSPPDMPAKSGKGRKPRAKVPMLFLPQISPDRPDDNQLRIEAAALELFTTQGFHGTNIRDIAEKAGVSQGAIYMYYPKKETIFESLVQSYQSCMLRFTRRAIMTLEDPFSRNDLRVLATAVRSIVYDDAQYLLLMFIDVVEFNNRHFADLFHDIPGQFRYLLGPVLNKVKRRPGWCGQDPAFVLATIYMFFYNYFVIERHMHGNQHLGPPEEIAIERLIDILSAGL
jgi:AcrR family transcriptional regulator